MFVELVAERRINMMMMMMMMNFQPDLVYFTPRYIARAYMRSFWDCNIQLYQLLIS